MSVEDLRDLDLPPGEDFPSFLERLVASSPMVAFRRTGPELALTYVSPNVEAVLGVSADEALGTTIDAAYARVHEADRGMVRDQVERALAGESVEITYRMCGGDGAVRWVVSTVRPDTAGSSGPALLGYVFDITSQRTVEEELEWLALHDPLTGLANRAKFASESAIHASLAKRKGWKMALLYVDLDKFKAVNDRFGHSAGDHVLEELARRIRGSVREEDLAARLGGDEFIVLLTDVEEDPADAIHRLHEQLTAPVPHEGHALEVGASIGVAFFPGDADSVDLLIRRADEAMYEAKRSRRPSARWQDVAERNAAETDADGTGTLGRE